ncbi:MAG: hypothetical protein ACJ715_00545 [Ornithinibacter sp.]
MNDIERDQGLGRKAPADVGQGADTTHPAVSTGVASGELKGRPRATDESGPTKLSVSRAKHGSPAEREVDRRDLPLPPAAVPEIDDAKGRSLGLRLEVSGDRITVLDSLEIDAPTAVPGRVRGTDFLALRAGDEILAVKRLIDPGIAVGIPDRSAPEFLGHREITLDTYELTILLPLEVIEQMDDRERQGTAGRPKLRATVEFEVYRAEETTELAPGLQEALRDRRGLERVAGSGELALDSLRGTAWADVRRRREEHKRRPEDRDSEDAD